MKTLTWSIGALCLAAFAAGAAKAQNPPQPAPAAGQDSGMMPMRWQRPGRPMMAQERRQRLLQQIQERFAARVQDRLGLTNQQMDRLRAVMVAGRDHRRQLDEQEQLLRRAVGEQLRPGVAANQDSLARLLDAVAANHVARAELERQELHDLSFLTPVQRAQLLLMRQMLMQRAEVIREGRAGAQPGRQGFGRRQAPAAPPGGQPQGPGPR
jgi:hypothetical protein